MDIESFKGMFNEAPVEGELAGKLQRITAAMIGKIIQKSNCAIKIPFDFDYENADYDIGIQINKETKEVTLVPMHSLRKHETSVEEIEFQNLGPVANGDAIQRYNGWQDASKNLPEEKKSVLVACEVEGKKVAYTGEYHNVGKEPSNSFFTFVKINDAYVKLPLSSATHWMFLPCPPSCNHENESYAIAIPKPNPALQTRMPYTQDRKSKKKKKRRK